VQEYDLKSLRLKVGDWAWVRYRVGSIPEMGRTPRLFNVALYAANGTQGKLLFADPNPRGGFDAIMNAYTLTKHGSRWTADEGNGGYVDYEAIGRFVTHLAHQRRYRVRLLPRHSSCMSDPM